MVLILNSALVLAASASYNNAAMTIINQQRLELEALIGDKYEVLRRIGGGGMAQVFLARHRLHGGFVAVKVLADHLAQDDRIVARFEQEARTAASLSGHPNVVPIFDVGQGNGLHFLIMQYVAGEDLGSYLKRAGKLSPADAANIIAQATEGLVWSESKRVVHRDLKPANMLLDINGRTIILDFGISKIADRADSLTRAGESLGTPHYMSPEQIRGEGCDVRSDLYSLGVVFFELLTGHRPFESESCTAIQMAHLSTPPPSLLTYETGLPPACEDIVQKLMQKERAHRYQSPTELLETLRSLGASSGPGPLRPIIDPEINEILHADLPASRIDFQPGSQKNSAEATTSTTPPHRQQNSTIKATPMHVGTEAPKSSTPTPLPTPAIVQEPTRHSSWVTATWIFTSLILVSLAGVLILGMQRFTPVIDDTHGKMLLVPAGNFTFGDNSPQSPNKRQQVYLRSYYVDETEVSNAEYKRFCDETGQAPPKTSDFLSNPSNPVAGVTEEDANKFAKWAGKRLPSEQEWEKAARGTDGRVYPWGPDPWVLDVPTELQPVNSLPDRRSPYGAVNMAGNVFEWTNSTFPATEVEYSDMRNALKSDSFSRSWYIIKGGCFPPNRAADFFRAYMRRGFPSDLSGPQIGFRCVKDVPQKGIQARLQSMFHK
jgi:serine/threonine protein kinase